MTRVVFYAVLCLTTLVTLSVVTSSFSTDEKQHWSTQVVPSSFRQQFLNHLLKYPDPDTQKATFIIGTSHVSAGFGRCLDSSIRTYAKPTMNAANYLRIAETLMLAASMNELQSTDLILEVSLIDNTPEQNQQAGLIFNALLKDSPLLLLLHMLSDNLSTYSVECLESSKPRSHTELLTKSQQQLAVLSPSKIDTMLTNYLQQVDALLSVCDNSQIQQFTLISLPIHTNLYNIPEVQKMFNAVEQRIQQHLAKRRPLHHCRVNYVNLTALGREFPDNKFWIDPGHFTPEVGRRVLSELQKVHVAQQ